MTEKSSRVFVRRNAQGAIQSLSRFEDAAHPEACAADTAEVAAFLRQIGAPPITSKFRESDLEMIRVVEDLIDVLIGKGVLRLTDLPDTVQRKLHERRQLRGSLRSLSLLDNDDEI